MKDRKRTLRPLELWNPGAIEKWLEDEAAKGWRLEDCGRVLATFRAMEPGIYRVRLRPQRPETPEARRERGEICREMGWDCTAVITGDDDYDCEVFYCGDPSAPELDTDPVARSWAWEKPLRRSWRVALVFLGLLVALPLVLSVLVGLAATWTKSKLTCDFLGEFQNIVLDIVGKIIIPILPFYIAATFCNLSYEGMITHQLPAFIQIILIVMAGHYIWLAVLYLLAGAYSKKNPWEVLRHYGPAYLTAVGTMSSAATLAVALRCARKSSVLREDMVSFGVPLFANIHLCGSVLTEVFFVMTIAKMLYGSIPSMGTMILCCLLLGIFAIGAPGVPGGTVMASLGLITGILLFDDAGTALMLAIFALQDSFGTACNVTGDGALTLMLTGYAEKHGIETQTLESPIL